MSKLTTTLQGYAKNLEILAALDAAYDTDKIPTSVYTNIESNPTYVYIYCYDTNRDTVLTAVAELFGTDNWTATTKGSGAVDWRTNRCGCDIIIYDAKVAPSVPDRPVSVREWPLQLTA